MHDHDQVVTSPGNTVRYRAGKFVEKQVGGVVDLNQLIDWVMDTP